MFGAVILGVGHGEVIVPDLLEDRVGTGAQKADTVFIFGPVEVEFIIEIAVEERLRLIAIEEKFRL